MIRYLLLGMMFQMYLSPEEFEEIFKMSKEAFYQLPRWKQDQVKKKVDLF